MVAMASKLFDVWAPAGFNNDVFLNHTKTLDQLWERLRTSPSLKNLADELKADKCNPNAATPTNDQLFACMELIQLMENVFLDLRLDDFWEHPDNRGWAMLFSMWAKSPIFRASWESVRRTFGSRFEYFCGERLGLPVDHPVARM
jgi:hypothetical protein